MYYASPGNTTLVSLAWMRPDMDKVDVMPRTAFGVFGHARAGPLEEREKSLVADFTAEYGGEFFVDNNYSHRYTFTAFAPADAENVKFDWDFGDGVSASAPAVEHVFVTAGVYAVRLTVHVGGNSETETTRLAVDRDWPNLDHATEDPALMQARVVAQYDVSRVPEPWLGFMIQMERQVQLTEAPMAAAMQMARLKRHARSGAALDILHEVAGDLKGATKLEAAVKLWQSVPPDSDLQPNAAAEAADLLIWRLADFPAALAATEPIADSSEPIAREARAQALIFSGRADEGKKILDALQQEQAQSPLRLAALSGALARTIEFRLDQRDWENGEEDWKTWQIRCPSVFLEGYSVVLRTRLMEQAGYAAAAAKVAEAFALAMADSPYSPQLLDRASKLVAKSDPAKSQHLRDTLKSRYPEDPLSQE
jgi:PKD repeat protein